MIVLKRNLVEVINNYFPDKNLYENVLQLICQKLNISSPKFLGDGNNGIAYLINNNRVLKLTKDESEAEIKYKILHTPTFKHLPKVDTVYRINLQSLQQRGYSMDDNIYVIIQEYAHDLTDEWHKFMSVFNNVCSDNEELEGWPEGAYLDNITDYYKNFHLIKEHMRKEMNFPMSYYNNMFGLISEMRKLGIDSIDFHSGNLGLSDSGNIIFFDLGFGSGGIYVKNEIII